jgi:hypothetical protein
VTRSVTEGGGSGSVVDVQAIRKRRAGMVEVVLTDLIVPP